jgi:hypothetical protein
MIFRIQPVHSPPLAYLSYGFLLVSAKPTALFNAPIFFAATTLIPAMSVTSSISPPIFCSSSLSPIGVASPPVSSQPQATTAPPAVSSIDPSAQPPATPAVSLPPASSPPLATPGTASDLDFTLPNFPSPCQWPRRFTKGTREHAKASKEAQLFKDFLTPFALKWVLDDAKKYKNNREWVKGDVLPSFLKEFDSLNLSSQFNYSSILDVRCFTSLSHICSMPFRQQTVYNFLKNM